MRRDEARREKLEEALQALELLEIVLKRVARDLKEARQNLCISLEQFRKANRKPR